MATLARIVPCLWFNDQALQAAEQYVSIFPNSRITHVAHYGDAGHEHHGRPAGSVMLVRFTLDGVAFTALNGGPGFTFNEAVSLQVMCDSQDEIDHFWSRLGEGGDPRAQQCGWLKDRFGVSWQVTPRKMEELMPDDDRPRSERVMTAVLGMKKIELAALERVAAGDDVPAAASSPAA